MPAQRRGFASVACGGGGIAQARFSVGELIEESRIVGGFDKSGYQYC
jgi:hypothetical protein